MQHLAIFVPGNIAVSGLIANLYKQKLSLPYDFTIDEQQTVIFSESAIISVIEEEEKHDIYLVRSSIGRGLGSMSSGERKKAYLNYLMASSFSNLILDNVFDNLDVSSVNELKKQLSEIGNQASIIQFFHRLSDVLPFIKQVYVYNVKGYLQPFSIEKQSLVSANTVVDIPIPPPIKYHRVAAQQLVKLNHVHVAYDGVPVLCGIQWTIEKNSFWQLKGPNGSGKTTLLGMIYGDNPKGYGQDMFLFGRKKGSGESIWEIKKLIGYFSSSMMHQFDRMDSVENMLVGGFHDSIGLYVPPSEMELKFAHHWLQIIGLLEKKHCLFRQLNLAEQRLLLVARAMVKHPPLLILDEPTAGLDDTQAALLIALIRKIANETETAVVYVSHRDEPGLKPQHIFELHPSAEGSIGTIS